MARRVRRRVSRPRRSAPSRARPMREAQQSVPPPGWMRARWPQFFQFDVVLADLQRQRGVDPEAVKAILFPNGQSPYMRMGEEREADDLRALLEAVAPVRQQVDPDGPVREMLDARITEWTDRRDALVATMNMYGSVYGPRWGKSHAVDVMDTLGPGPATLRAPTPGEAMARLRRRQGPWQSPYLRQRAVALACYLPRLAAAGEPATTVPPCSMRSRVASRPPTSSTFPSGA
jgi:hypothetical protein